MGPLPQRLSFAVAPRYRPGLCGQIICVLDTSPAHLQRLLDIAHAILIGVALKLGIAKAKVLVLGASLGNASTWTARRGTVWAAVLLTTWTCGDLLLERVAEYKYLSMVFSAVAGTGQAAFKCLRGQRFASWDSLREQFGNLQRACKAHRHTQSVKLS